MENLQNVLENKTKKKQFKLKQEGPCPVVNTLFF